MDDRDENDRLALRLRLSAETVRELAKICPVDVPRMLAVARQAEAMAAELDEITRSVNMGRLRRLSRQN